MIAALKRLFIPRPSGNTNPDRPRPQVAAPRAPDTVPTMTVAQFLTYADNVESEGIRTGNRRLIETARRIRLAHS